MTFVSACRVDKAKFAAIRSENDAVVVATGGTKSRFFPWEGVEHLTMGLEYLKAINRGEKPKTGKHVVVIGAGNSGMDTCRGAYEMGAETVVAVDVQKPAAFADEIAYIEGLGGKLVWPFFTSKITPEGVYGNDGRFIPADQVIVSIGEEPVLDFLPEDEGIEFFRKSWLVPKSDLSIAKGIFTAGDTIKPGRLTDAIGSGRKAAWYVDQYVMGQEEKPFPEKKQIPAERLSKAYFDKCHHCLLGDPVDDHTRCVSCGTCRDCKMCLESCPEKPSPAWKRGWQLGVRIRSGTLHRLRHLRRRLPVRRLEHQRQSGKDTDVFHRREGLNRSVSPKAITEIKKAAACMKTGRRFFFISVSSAGKIEVCGLHIEQVGRIHIGINAGTNLKLLQIIGIFRQDILRIAFYMIEPELHHTNRSFLLLSFIDVHTFYSLLL